MSGTPGPGFEFPVRSEQEAESRGRASGLLTCCPSVLSRRLRKVPGLEAFCRMTFPLRDGSRTTLPLTSKVHKAICGCQEGFRPTAPRGTRIEGSRWNSCRAWTSGLYSQAGAGCIFQPYSSGFNFLGLSRCFDGPSSLPPPISHSYEVCPFFSAPREPNSSFN